MVDQLVNEIGVTQLVAKIMVARGVDNINTGRHYIATNSTLSYGEWNGNEQTERAADRIITAIINGELIYVYGDFDADGVTSCAAMMTTLRALGAKNLKPYIPKRVDEGYGVNKKALNFMAKDGAKLVITVDCGIRSIEEARYCRDVCGMDIIITDHHNFGNDVPDSYALINPKDPRYPYTDPMLAGSGVAFRFGEYLYRYAMGTGAIKKPRMEWAEIASQLTQMVAIGTVADLVPLNEIYNRVIVKHGLSEYMRNPQTGVKALAEASRLSYGLTSTELGFNLGPRINAAGRLQDAMLAYRMLMAKEYEEALIKAMELNVLNERRQELTKTTYDQAKLILGSEIDTNPYMAFVPGEGFTPGIVGLVAGKLMNELNRISLVMEISGTEAHGSARSIKGISIIDMLDLCQDLLIAYGGHNQAAGFTLKAENIPEFKARLQAGIEANLRSEDMIPSINIDSVVPIQDVNEKFLGELKVLEPTGKSNEEPVFQSNSVILSSRRVIGKNSDHVSFTIATSPGKELSGVAFGWGNRIKALGVPLNIAYTVGKNSYNGKTSTQIMVKDFSLI
jgi:single-stranded-DNA-specific exonuclease